MRQARRIILQALEGLPSGEIRSKVSRNLKPPKGEVYHSIEAPKGELGFYIISDGSPKPFRMKVRAPSFVNLQAVFGVTNARYLADMIAVLGSLDPVMAEVDK